jgi:Flp pilus assembly pilin Flp
MEPSGFTSQPKEIRTLLTIKQLIRDEQGAELVEYGLLACLIALLVFAGVHALGRSTRSLYPRSIVLGSKLALPF